MKTKADKTRSAFIWKTHLVVLAGVYLGTCSCWAGVQDLVGRYVGAWTNVTFGFTGKAVIEIQATGAEANLVFDMDGHVFGMVDPPVINMPGTVSGDVILIDNKGVGMFGDIKGSVDAAQKTFSATLTNIPGGFIEYVTAVGTIEDTTVGLDYTVKFPGPTDPYNPAYGVMVAIKGQPALTITRVWQEGQNLAFEWAGGQGPFQVQTRTNLALGTWQDYGSQTTVRTSSVPIGTGPIFYRIGGQ